MENHLYRWEDKHMKKWNVIDKKYYVVYKNRNGADIGISKQHRQKVIEVDGCIFKDLNGSGILEAYKDWRLDSTDRAQDLAQRLSIQEIAGLMLYSKHQTVTKFADKYANLFGNHTYDGKLFSESSAEIFDLSDQQKAFLSDGVRHVLISSMDNKIEGAKWCNQLQAFCENFGVGIPVNVCSDPRHGIKADAEYNLGAGSDISKWPEEIGLAATFDPHIVERFGEILALEYRNLGISTALSPQVDLASDPRWSRYSGTFGENVKLTTTMAEAYCNGAQNSDGNAEIANGWGYHSVNTMVKHWPGGGTGEGGRDAHYAYGKYAVYPGGNFQEHLKPFIEGAFQLQGKTRKCSAVMPYYTITYEKENSDKVGNSYSKYIIKDLLREQYGYDGVVCTDWLITADHGPSIGTFSGKCWGVETLSIVDRHVKALEAGVDQFGGNNEITPVLEAYQQLVEKYGLEHAKKRFQASAYRILLNMFRVGLFDQPYVDIEQTEQIVGCPAFIEAGYEAQLKSAVLLKNKASILPLAKGTKVYIPERLKKQRKDWFGNLLSGESKLPLHKDTVSAYFQLVSDPEEADVAIVCMNNPISNGYVEENGIGEYIPISLQYRPYTCLEGRTTSIASGDPLEMGNRSYFGKTSRCENEYELDMLLDTKAKMKQKPIIVCMYAKKPFIASEFEKDADAIVVHFGIQDYVLLDLLCGNAEPSGLLPFTMPCDMHTVETHCEDVCDDIIPYKDEEDNVYEFAYGRNFHEQIIDDRLRFKQKERS